MLTEKVGVPLTTEEKEDMVEAWHVIGHHLGILPQFNVCGNGLDAANGQSVIVSLFCHFFVSFLSLFVVVVVVLLY